MFSTYDIESLKAGDWVEYEEEIMEEKMKTRMACVAIEEDVAWIEYTDRNILFFWNDTVLLFAVGRKDRLISKALWGSTGQVGREIRVTPREKDSSTPAVALTGTAVASEDTLKVNGKDLKCEKVALDYKSGESAFRNRVWASPEVPFRYSPPTARLEDLKWEGKATWPGGMVKREVENPSNGKVVEMILCGWGHDAAQTLKLK